MIEAEHRGRWKTGIWRSPAPIPRSTPRRLICLSTAIASIPLQPGERGRVGVDQHDRAACLEGQLGDAAPHRARADDSDVRRRRAAAAYRRLASRWIPIRQLARAS